MSFASRLKALMDARGEDTVSLGEKLSVSSQAVGMWRSGKTIPGSRRLPKLAKILGVEPSDLVDPSPGKQPAPYEFVEDRLQLRLLRLWRLASHDERMMVLRGLGWDGRDDDSASPDQG